MHSIQVRQNKAAQRQALGTTLGTGYNTTLRKQVAYTIFKHVIPHEYRLTPEGNAYALQLLQAGLTRSTLTRWLRNYCNFTGCFVVDHQQSVTQSLYTTETCIKLPNGQLSPIHPQPYAFL